MKKIHATRVNLQHDYIKGFFIQSLGIMRKMRAKDYEALLQALQKGETSEG